MYTSEDGHHAADGEEAKNEMSHEAHHTPPRVVVVGTETAVFQEGSPVRERILAYTKCLASTDIIVMCGKKFEKEQVREHVALYPTNSRTRFMRIFNAIRIGKKLPRADVVTAQDPFETGLAGFFIARALGARLHVQIHTDFLSPHFARLSLVNRCRALLARFVLSRADRVRVVSERIAQSLQTKNYTLKTNPTALPIFVDISAIRAATPSPDLVNHFSKFKTRLLVVSRLEPEKNVALTVVSFARSAPKNACLIIVGDGRERGKLERLAQNEGVMGRVFFEGKQDAANYYALADLVLVPSRYEGYGLVIIEALAAGKPVLSTDVCIAREQGAIVVSPERFAGALSEWFKNGPREGHLVGYPYASVEEYVQKYCADISRCVTPVAVT